MNAAILYEKLDRLPSKCDSFDVRFTTHDRSESFESLLWSVDDDGDLRLWRPEDDDEWERASQYTVDELKDLLAGYDNHDEDDDDQQVCDDSEVFVVDPDWDEDGDPDHTFYSICYRRFEINWKRHRVDVFID